MGHIGCIVSSKVLVSGSEVGSGLHIIIKATISVAAALVSPTGGIVPTVKRFEIRGTTSTLFSSHRSSCPGRSAGARAVNLDSLVPTGLFPQTFQ